MFEELFLNVNDMVSPETANEVSLIDWEALWDEVCEEYPLPKITPVDSSL